MNELFGIPMSSIMVVLIVLLSLCLLSVAWVAWRRPVIFKLGVRNIPRRQAQTTLIVVGLMLSTLLIAAALGTGDTLDHSSTVEVYDNLGRVDELVIFSTDVDDPNSGTSATIPATSLNLVEQTLAGDPNVDGVMPLLEEHVPAVNPTSNLGEPDVVVVGLDPARVDTFGGLKATNGDAIDLATIGSDAVVLSERAADKLEAKTGDSIQVFYANQQHSYRVAAVAQNTYLSGARRNPGTGLEIPGMAMPLASLQRLTNQPDRLSAVAVSNAGGVRDGLDLTDDVVARLAPALQGQSLGVDAVKKDQVDAATQFAQIFTGLFLVLGLFSIAAGILLIVLIFTMLAAERRSEMGMSRAIGAHRRQLIQQFVSEGSGYALLAGLVGAGLGALAALGIGQAMGLLFGDYVNIEPKIAPRSLIVAYALGVVITFLAVVGSSWKISRLNVVAAIRDLPDATNPRRKKRTLVWAGLLLLLGALLTMTGVSSERLAPFGIGMSLLPFGVALILRFFGVPSRPVFTTVGLYLLVFWLLPQKQFERIFGHYDGDIEMFFISGIAMVIAATIVIIENTDVLLAGVSRLGGLFKSKLPAVRTAVAYPGAARGRTGMTIAMFSLIVFSLVMIATMNRNFVNLFLGDEANAGWDVRADALSANPIGDFTSTLQAQGVATSDFKALGVTSNPSTFFSQLRLTGAGDAGWKVWPVLGMDEGFITKSALKFQQRAKGYETNAAVIAALQSQPNVAVIDSFALKGNGNFGGPDNQFQLSITADDKVFDPITVELANPSGGPPLPVTIIGVIDSNIGSLYGLYANQRTIDEVFPRMTFTSYYVALDHPDRADAVAKQIEAAMLQNGVQATSIRDQLEESQQQITGFLYIIQGFMGLGLLVGVAAIGVIAFRSVVERRQQIGVLRAIGYQKGTVALSFLIETAFVVGLGLLAGTVLAIVLAHNLFTSDEVGSSSSAAFIVPWGIIAVVLGATVVVALLMTWIPARQASRIAPAEALRYE
jgi:putative ABC transport system permease protein